MYTIYKCNNIYKIALFCKQKHILCNKMIEKEMHIIYNMYLTTFINLYVYINKKAHLCIKMIEKEMHI